MEKKIYGVMRGKGLLDLANAITNSPFTKEMLEYPNNKNLIIENSTPNH